MNYETILYKTEDRIATITLNRPDRLNAWTAQMEKEVCAAMRAAEADAGVRAIILTGAGRGFCAGADMESLGAIADKGIGERQSGRQSPQQSGNGAPANVRPDFGRQYSYFPSIEKPIIAAVNGAAAGLGFVMTLYCDVRFASDAAKFTTSFSRRGLIAEHGISWLLPRIVGVSRALDLLFTARKFDAAEALQMGLVSRVIPQDRFMGEVLVYAQTIADEVSPRSTRIMKRQIWTAMFQDLGTAIDEANVEMIESLKCDDFKEGVAHFVEKRAPAFTGK